jgi:formate/nitrite transporter FocA (FNT family)
MSCGECHRVIMSSNGYSMQVTTARRRRPPTPAKPEREVEEAFDRIVDEGRTRLARPLPALISTGLLGGIDIGSGVLAYLLIDHYTGSKVLAGFAFSIGFIAILLARSELFTENFLVPVTAAISGRGRLAALGRLWGVTLVANLAGGWVMSWLILTALPELKSSAVSTGTHYATLGISLRSFALAVLAGAIITLMTRMQHATESLGVQLVPAIVMGSLLPIGQLFHCILDSFFMFAALIAGAPFGYLNWLSALGWAALGNILGGLVLVTAIRLLRVPHRVMEARTATES